jgi:hypothetical protein
VVWSVSQLLYLLQRAGHFKFLVHHFFVGLGLVVAVMFLASCASQQPPPGLSDTKSQTIKDRDRDLYECERESAFAGVGEKRRVFDKCMKARGY